jgi:DNA-binding transcriptional regulator YiaG
MAVRVDSPPCNHGQQLAEMLIEFRKQTTLTREALAARMGVSLGTLKNWERSRTRPSKSLWKKFRLLVKNAGM